MTADQRVAPGSDEGSSTPKTWWRIVRGAWKESKADRVPLLSAGVAFYGFLALVPSLIAVVLVYGLTSDPEDVAEQIDSFGSGLPSSAEELLREQMSDVVATPDRSLGIGLVIALVIALWSASSGVSNLMTALNVAYDVTDERRLVKSKVLALAFTLAAVLFVVLAIALVAAVPVVLRAVDAPGWVEGVAQAGRWVGLVVVVLVALALLYRWAPHRPETRLRWLSKGAIVATLLWLIVSAGFSVYVDNFGSYGKTYGSLAGVVVLLLWLWLTAYAVLLGAEINAEAERQVD